MAYNIVTLQSDAVSLEQLQDKLLGYPRRGTPIGPGIHVLVQQSWDGTGAVPLGWSSYKGSSIKHPTLSQWATPVDPGASAALATDTKLSAPEKTTMSMAIATAVTLPADWNPTPVLVDAQKDV